MIQIYNIPHGFLLSKLKLFDYVPKQQVTCQVAPVCVLLGNINTALQIPLIWQTNHKS